MSFKTKKSISNFELQQSLLKVFTGILWLIHLILYLLHQNIPILFNQSMGTFKNILLQINFLALLESSCRISAFQSWEKIALCEFRVIGEIFRARIEVASLCIFCRFLACSSIVLVSFSESYESVGSAVQNVSTHTMIFYENIQN